MLKNDWKHHKSALSEIQGKPLKAQKELEREVKQMMKFENSRREHTKNFNRSEANRELNYRNGVLLQKLVEISQGKQLSVCRNPDRESRFRPADNESHHRDQVS